VEFDIKKYANLARINLTKEEEERFQKDLEELLGHVDELKKVNVSSVEPMTGGTNLKNALKDDSPERDELFNTQFPSVQNGYLKVPKILDKDKDEIS